jgi:hypothetical protein
MTDLYDRLRRSLPKSVVHLESDSDSDDCDHSSSRHSASSSHTTATSVSRDSASGPNKRLKLPSFTGTKENWEIWYNRFADVTERFGLSESQKLDELLPRLVRVKLETLSLDIFNQVKLSQIDR